MDDNTKHDHLLQKHNILKIFYVSKQVTKNDLSDLYKKLGLSEKTADDKTKRRLQKTIQTMASMGYFKDDIPGMINKESPDIGNIENKKIHELLTMSSMICDLLMQSELTPRECGFVLGSAIKKLNLNNPGYFNGFDSDENIF
jgi:hypothetical protein